MLIISHGLAGKRSQALRAEFRDERATGLAPSLVPRPSRVRRLQYEFRTAIDDCAGPGNEAS